MSNILRLPKLVSFLLSQLDVTFEMLQDGVIWLAAQGSSNGIFFHMVIAKGVKARGCTAYFH